MPPRVNVCICTYKRASIDKTLQSLAEQDYPRTELSVIVADNDETDDLKASILELGRSLGLDLLYVHAPARNISIARNACLNAATAELLAFIDDDEWAAPHWLSSLVSALDQSGASVALGPVHALYDASAPPWFERHRIHDTYPTVLKGGVIKDGYTCNVLMRRADIVGLIFDETLGRSGGEDTDFFNHLTNAGRTIVFSQKAELFERVTEGRLKTRWMMSRAFRSGQTHARILRTKPARRVVEIPVASAKFAYALGTGLIHFNSPGKRTKALLRATLHAGVVCRLIGLKDIQIY